MKKFFTYLITVSAMATSSVEAQDQAPAFDKVAAQATLSQAAKKSRFTPKSSVVSRKYTKNGKGVSVEIIEFATGEKEERPYVPVPILFVRSTDTLLDDVSRANVGKLADVLKSILKEQHGCRFTIQGHTSAEGSEKANQQLSVLRSQKIHSLLVEGHGIDAARLRQVAFGEKFAEASERAAETELQKDRRVLVVRD